MTCLRKILSLAFIAVALGVWVGTENPKLALYPDGLLGVR